MAPIINTYFEVSQKATNHRVTEDTEKRQKALAVFHVLFVLCYFFLFVLGFLCALWLCG